MKLRFFIWSILLHCLAVMCFHGSEAREMPKEELMVDPKISIDDDIPIPEGVNVLQLHSTDIGREQQRGDDETRNREDTWHMHVHGHGHGNSLSSSSRMDMDDHLDPAAIMFFTVNDLTPGKTLPIYFDKQNPGSSPPPLLQSKKQADSIPFSYSQLPNLLEFFSFPQDSPQAKAMEETLRKCESKPNIGETKLCATSKESMLDFVGNIFELDSKYFRSYSTSYLTKNSTTLLQNYTILEVPKIKEIPAPKMVACHTLPYPYLIFLCHSVMGESKVFEVALHGQNEDRVDAFAVCHMDTSTWSPHHVSFHLLGIEPGTSPVCHFFPADNLIWVPN